MVTVNSRAAGRAGVTFFLPRFHAQTDLNAAQSGDEATMGQAKRETELKKNWSPV